MQIKYILFDLDGTLTDPALGITSCVNYALSKFGKQVEDLSELNAYIGPPLITCFQELNNLTPEQAWQGVGYYRERFAKEGIFQNEVYPDIPEVLKKLVGEGYKLMLATSKPQEFATIILEHFGILKYFTFVAGNNLKEERPKKEQVIAYLIENYPEINGNTAIMVGDRSYDVVGAREFGIDTVAVSFGYGSMEELTKAGAKYIAQTPWQIYEMIKGIS